MAGLPPFLLEANISVLEANISSPISVFISAGNLRLMIIQLTMVGINNGLRKDTLHPAKHLSITKCHNTTSQSRDCTLGS